MAELTFERITLEQGLSQNSILSIIQDQQGFMWFGTEEGLNRYDGYSFKIYKNNLEDHCSIASNFVKTIYEDREGVLWIGTINGFLIKYTKEEDRFINVKMDNPDMEVVSELTSIIQAEDRKIWVGSYNGGLKIFDRKNIQPKNTSYLESIGLNNLFNDVSTLYFDRSGRVWIGTWENGVYNYDCRTNVLINFKNDREDIGSLSHNNIRCIFEDNENNIWIGTKNGLNLLDSGKKEFARFFYSENSTKSSIQINSICQDKNNEIWVGTNKNGLVQFDRNHKHLWHKFDNSDSNSLSNDSVYRLFVDRTNVLWIGTLGGGLNRLDCSKKRFFNIKKSTKNSTPLYFNSIISFYIDNFGLKWIGTYNSGIYILENDNLVKNKDVETQLKELLDEAITSIIEDENSNIWFSCLSKELFVKFCRDKQCFKIYKHTGKYGINSLLIYKNFLWIAIREKGLLKFDIENEKFVDFFFEDQHLKKLLSEMIYSLYIDKEETVWAGSVTEGLFCFNLNSNITRNYKLEIDNKNSISDDCILCITEDKKNNLWIGTNSGGLNKFSREQEIFVRYTMEDGLPNNMVKGIVEDDYENLWISSNKGISRFNPKNKTFRNFDAADGLQSNEFNDGTFFKHKDGTLYFGGINGITYFKPEEIKDNPYIPNIVITDFQVFNESVKSSPENKILKQNITHTKEITITHKESVFSFEFAALIFNNPQKNQYAYMMENFDKDWVYCGTRRQATYTNLNPGEYVFRVKGSNNDGIWNEEGTGIKITIDPPYYKTWWFKSLSVLGVIAATGLTYRQRLEKIEKERQEQEEFSRKLIDSQESERKRISSELHDTIAHDILISKNKALMALKHKDNKETLENALKEISDQATVTINDVRNISYDLHPHQLERLGFTKTIESIINNVTKSTGISFSLETDDVDEVLSKKKEINLYRAIQESVTNIVKHSKATEASLKVSLIENFLIISISDNGIGFDMNKKTETNNEIGLGLPGIIERIKLMNGDFSIESNVNKGTVLRFRIPVNIN
ncbi:MAG: two-component regulator propeller domain-containing protein [Ignavibacteria bacterium]